MKYQLDLCQFACPVPLLMLKKAVAQLKTGEQLCVLFNKQTAVENWKIFCQQNHCILLEQKWLSGDQFQAIFSK